MAQSENQQALQKILDLIRMSSVIVLLMHFYVVGHATFQQWGCTISFVDHFLDNLLKNFPLLSGMNRSKLVSLGLLFISVAGDKGKKSDTLTLAPILYYIIIGCLLYFLSSLFFEMTVQPTTLTVLYITVTATGYLSMLAGGARMSRLLYLRLGKDIFNDLNETFPQEERLLTNEYSVNLPAQYNLKGRTRRMWINIINPFRGTLVLGTPGSGKSFFVIRHIITQHIAKGFTFFIYDFKFPDLTLIAYNTVLKHRDKYPPNLRLYMINFDDLSRSHRCNLLSPESMFDITDAAESSRTIMLALSKQWITKSGDFFVESPINFVTAIFWFLKQYQNGIYCTLPHAIELTQVEYDKLWPVLAKNEQISVLINPFVSAYLHHATEQLEGQIASAKICLARLSSPSLYYILSGNDFTLDLNNPEAPKIVCVGNNPAKVQIYGAVISLCTERMLKLVNRKGQLKSSLIFDEFPTIYVGGIDRLIATARSNKVATTLGIQDLSQLRKDYGREQAEVIMNVAGNVISGQVLGDTAKQLSERIGKINQERESVSINSNDTSVSKSLQLEAAIQPSRIASLSSGQFVGAVADDPGQRIERKAFYGDILNDIPALQREEASYQGLPVIRKDDQTEVMQTYYGIKRDIQQLVDREMATLGLPKSSGKLPDPKKTPATQNASF